MQHGPLQRERLSRRQPSFRLRLFLQLSPVAQITKQCHLQFLPRKRTLLPIKIDTYWMSQRKRRCGPAAVTKTRKRIRLADIDFEPADPPRHEVVDQCSEGSADTADDAVHDRENNNGAETHPKAQHFRGGSIGPSHARKRTRHHGKQCYANPDEEPKERIYD